MKRTTIFFTLLVCSFFSSMGQNIDSLIKIIPELSGIEAVDVLNTVTKWYACRSRKDAIEYHLLTKKQLDKIDYPSGETTFLTIKGSMIFCSGYADSALVQFKEALQLAKKTGTKEAEAMINANMGSIYGYKRDLDKALLAFQESRRIGIKLGNVKLQIGCTYNMAHVQEKRLRLDSAWMLYQETEELGKKHNRVEYILKGKVGLLSLKVSHNYKSIEPEDFIVALGLAELEKNPRAVYSISDYASTYYKKLEQLDSALFYLEKCQEANKILQDKEGSMSIAADLSSIYALNQDYNKALEFVNQSIKVAQEINRTSALPQLYTKQASYYLSIKSPTEAISSAKKSIAIADSLSGKSLGYNKHEAYLYLSKSYEAINNNSLALSTYKKYFQLYQEFLDSQESDKFSELQTKYETEKKEAQIIKLAKENEIAELESKQNKNYFISASMIGLLTLGISVIAYNQLRLRRKADLAQEQLRNSQETMKLENQFREAELKALKSQMNPHFIFNALNSIQEYIILNDKENAANYLGKFADLIRNYLYHSNMGKLSLADELESLKLYLELEQVRFEEDFTFEIKKTLQDSAENIEIPTMLIQPYVENAIKHGLLHKSGEKKLLLQFIERENSLDCEIVDNGVGRVKSGEINAKRRKGHQSFASEATQSRLELLNHQSDSKIGVEIIDLIDGTQALGTKVIISVPKQ